MTVVTITTYNRPEMLLSLLKQLTEQPTKKEIRILVFDDSPLPYGGGLWYYKKDFNLRFFNFHNHNGKRGYWNVVNKIFTTIKEFKSFDYFIQLQDDIVLCDNFIDKAIESYEAINDPKKISLYLHEGESRKDQPCWTNVYPVTVKWEGEEYSLTQWVDMCAFIVKKDFLEALNYEIQPIPESRWAKDKTLSSGVGQQISRRLYKDYHLYRKPHVTHGDHKSVMHE